MPESEAGPDREAQLRDLADRVSDHDAVADAWLAKSFTDRLLVVDLVADRALPPAIPELLAEHDCYGANDVYDVPDDSGSFSGAVAGGNRHQFVDVRTRGDHQSYVLE